MRKIHFFLALSFSIFSITDVNGVNKDLKMNNLFSDHMVLQQQKTVDFWGQAAPGDTITIITSWGKEDLTVADVYGNWKVKLATPKAGGPYTIKVRTSCSTINISDVLIGEVWLASGQSNMDIPLQGWLPEDTIFNSKTEIERANYPAIRLFKVAYNISTTTVDSMAGGEWNVTSPATAGNFSATAYFYAKKLYEELHIPIGIIQSSIGGTPVEAWTSKEELVKFENFNKTIAGLDKLKANTDNWFNRYPIQVIPSTVQQWENINFDNIEAAKPDYNDSKWPATTLPGRFDRLSSGDFDGAIWLRKVFKVQDTLSDYNLKIGGMDDLALVYINGKKIGLLSGGGFPGVTDIVIPKSSLLKGNNTIAILAIDTGGPGAINGPILLSNAKGEDIPLQGTWKSQLIAEFTNGNLCRYDLHTNISLRPDISLLNSNTPTVLFNAMIHPIIHYAIKGAIWYQGESNVGRADQYKSLFPAMIRDWRNKWGTEFPFYYVQIAPYLYGASDQKNQSQKLRNAQRYALKLPKTGMAVTLDIGKLTTAHPAFKQDVGNRLARFALAGEYGKEQVTSGPLYKNVTVAGNKLIVAFETKSIGSGLQVTQNGLTGFEIAGIDKIFVPAHIEINGSKIIVSSPEVGSPVYVRYAWSDGAAATLFNKEGLPASTFTSEE